MENNSMSSCTRRWLVIWTDVDGNRTRSFTTREKALAFALSPEAAGKSARVIDAISGGRVYGKIRHRSNQLDRAA
jgi:hypothetical protein